MRLRFWIRYLVVVIVVALFALEAAVRLAGIAPQLPEQYAKNSTDPYLPWKPEPLSLNEGRTREFTFSYRHNRMGFRDTEHQIAKPAGTLRILTLGDSFTYGIGAAFDETYPSRLQQVLSERFRSQKIEVINAGIPRYWPEPERLLLQHYGLAYEPDLVTVGFLPNDVLDTYVGITGIDVNQGFLVTRKLDAFGGAGMWLYLRSQLFRTLFVPYLTRQIQAEASRTLDDRAPAIYRANGVLENEWRAVEAEYAKMHELANTIGAKLAVIFIPPHIPWPPATEPYPQQRLASWARTHGVTFVDTSDALAAASAIEPMHYPQDGHCTPAGYGVIARTVAAALLESPFMPLPRPAP